MTTTITPVGSARGSGGIGVGFTTLQAWWNALPATINIGDTQVAALYNDSEFTAGLADTGNAKTISGSVIIRAATAADTGSTGQGFRDNATKSTNPLRYDVSKGVGINMAVFDGYLLDFTQSTSTNITIDGLQLKNTDITGGTIRCDTPANNFVKNCIHDLAGARNQAGLYLSAGSGNYTVVNNAIILRAVTTTPAILFDNGTVGIAVGNTIYSTVAQSTTGSGITTNFGVNAVAIDNAIFNFGTHACTVANSGTYSSSSDYNATDSTAVGTAQGTHNQVSLTIANEIKTTGTTPDLRALVTGHLPNNGLREQTYTSDLDIYNQARSTTTPTIGAWEYTAGGISMQILAQRRRRMLSP